VIVDGGADESLRRGDAKPVCTENFIRIDWSKESPNVSAQ